MPRSTRQRHDNDAIVVLVHDEGAVGYRIDRNSELLRDWQGDNGFYGLGQEIHHRKRLAAGIGGDQGARTVVVIDGRWIDTDPVEGDRVSVCIGPGNSGTEVVRDALDDR